LFAFIAPPVIAKMDATNMLRPECDQVLRLVEGVLSNQLPQAICTFDISLLTNQAPVHYMCNHITIPEVPRAAQEKITLKPQTFTDLAARRRFLRMCGVAELFCSR